MQVACPVEGVVGVEDSVEIVIAVQVEYSVRVSVDVQNSIASSISRSSSDSVRGGVSVQISEYPWTEEEKAKEKASV